MQSLTLSCALLLAAPGAEPVDAAALDAARGGFTLAPGLELSLGIERMVAINGDMVAQSRLDLTGRAGLSLDALAPLLVQNGAGNLAQAGLPAAMLIQNTLNHQHIDSRTVIHATVNSATLLDTINFQGQLSDALARAAAPH